MRKLTLRETTEQQRQALQRLPALTRQATESKAIWSAIISHSHMLDELNRVRADRDRFRTLAALAAQALDAQVKAEQMRAEAREKLAGLTSGTNLSTI